MTASQNLPIKTFQLIDGEGRLLGTLENCQADLERDAPDEPWELVAFHWEAEIWERGSYQKRHYAATYRDADRRTWQLILASWEAGGFGAVAAEECGEPENEMEWDDVA